MDDRPNLPEVRELLRIIDAAMSGLLELKAVRTRNLPVGDIAELLVSACLDLTLAETIQPGFDATDSSGTRYQIKGIKSPGRLRSSPIRQPYDFEFVIVVIFDHGYTVRSVVKIPRDVLFTTQGLMQWSKRLNAYQVVWKESITYNDGIENLMNTFRQRAPDWCNL